MLFLVNMNYYFVINNYYIDGVSVTSISVTSLGSPIYQEVSSFSNESYFFIGLFQYKDLPSNKSIMNEYNKLSNMHAKTRDYLIKYMNKLAILDLNSIKLQASVLVQLTHATNQLMRTTTVKFHLFSLKYDCFIFMF